MFCRHGALNVLITNPRDIPAFIAELRALAVHVHLGVNTLYNALLNRRRSRELDFSKLKLGVAGGMALHPASRSAGAAPPASR